MKRFFISIFLALLATCGAGFADTASISAAAASAFQVYIATNVAIPAAAPLIETPGNGTVGIDSNVNWDLFVQGTNEGKMKHTTAVPDEIATNALKVSIGSTLNQVLTGSAAKVLDNQAFGYHTLKSTTYRQTFTYDDLAGSYGITVTWTIAPHV